MADDPIMGMLPAERPRRFEGMQPEEQRWRARVFLMIWVLSQHVSYAWAMALVDDREQIEFYKGLVDITSDEEILEAVQNASELMTGPAEQVTH